LKERFSGKSQKILAYAEINITLIYVNKNKKER
jgi:hypothetical protein